MVSTDEPRVGDCPIFPVCPRCQCRAEGEIVGFNVYRDPIFWWALPPDDCTCDCHAPFRMLRGPRPTAKQRVA